MQELDNNSTMINSELAVPKIPKLDGWVSFMGVVSIIMGALTCLGIITAAIGVPMIISGLKLMKAVDQMKMYEMNNDLNNVADAMTNVNKYFKIVGILMIVGIVLQLILIPLSMIFAFSTMSDFSDLYY